MLRLFRLAVDECKQSYMYLLQYKMNLCKCFSTLVPKQARSEIDEDGFFEGEVCGRVGLVPENMVEEITSPEELSQVPELLAAQAERKKELGEADEGGERGV